MRKSNLLEDIGKKYNIDVIKKTYLGDKDHKRHISSHKKHRENHSSNSSKKGDKHDQRKDCKTDVILENSGKESKNSDVKLVSVENKSIVLNKSFDDDKRSHAIVDREINQNKEIVSSENSTSHINVIKIQIQNKPSSQYYTSVTSHDDLSYPLSLKRKTSDESCVPAKKKQTCD